MLDIPTCCPYLDTGHFDSANAQTISIQFKALSKLCDPLCLCGWMLLIECVDLARRPKFRKVESGIDRVSSALRHIKCGHGNTGHKDRILPPTPTYSDFDGESACTAVHIYTVHTTEYGDGNDGYTAFRMPFPVWCIIWNWMYCSGGCAVFRWLAAAY